MAPLAFLVGGFLVLSLARRHWSVALRGGLAAMFTATGGAHFIGLREELVAMVPPALPAPELLVTVTGVLELAGAAALLWARTAPWAAAGLGVLLVAMFPANVYAARHGLSPSFGDQLVPRTLLQVVFLAAVAAVVAHHVRSRRAAIAP
ncbi:DoxX family protein [Actinosynnema sp. NPDC059797]